MGLAHSPSIVRDGLILHLDAANKKSYASNTLEVEYLIVAGGGGGGSGHTGSSLGGGGGGAGGVLIGKTSVSGSNTITVGAGGTGANGPASNSTAGIDTNTEYPNSTGGNGSDSVAFGLTAVGGGGGGTRNAHENGKDGGSGGGACGTGADGSPASGGTATSGQGNNGGSNNAEWGACGGGGYTQAGQSLSGSSTRATGYGGAGFFNNLISQYFAGGGGGGGQNDDNSRIGGAGGIGGGGDGGDHAGETTAPSGAANTGGGGGGAIGWIGNGVDSNGGSGGSGIVVVRYAGPQKAFGGIITEENGYTVHKFVNSGSFVVGTNVGDISNNKNNGQLFNGVGYNSSNGGSFVFDGANDYIQIPYSNLLQFTTQFTLEAFLYSIDNAENWASLVQYPYSSAAHTDPYFEWGIYLRQDARRIHTRINGITRETANGVWNHNEWMQVVITYNGPGNSVSFYHNGALVTTNTAPASSIVYENNNPVLIGTNASNSEQFEGRLGTMRLYNRSLTAQEIQQNFEATRGRYGI